LGFLGWGADGGADGVAGLQGEDKGFESDVAGCAGYEDEVVRHWDSGGSFRRELGDLMVE
jgi:hypothetical protein